MLLSGGKNVKLSDIDIRNEAHTGDLGNIVRMHGRIYGREYGDTPEFEGTIAVLDEVPEKNYAELR